MGKMRDLTGQVFGKLTVIECAGKLDGKNYYWHCKCECGNEKDVVGSALTSGNTKTCGCGKYDGLKKYNQEQSEKSKLKIGTRFGKLEIIEDLGFIPHVEGHNRRGYLCKCDCGNLKEVTGNSLSNGHTLSCGQCGLRSKGEYLVQKILEEKGCLFTYDSVYLPLLKETGRRLRFDFIVYNNDETPIMFIEFDGRQHYTGPDTEHWSRTTDTLDSIKERDKIKNKFCLQHNLRLVRIPYWKREITESDIFGDKFLMKGDDDVCQI